MSAGASSSTVRDWTWKVTFFGNVPNSFTVKVRPWTAAWIIRDLPVLLRKRKLMLPSEKVASCPFGR
ncbi:hypothetical protein D3C74_439280 [compost metagenome]